jgi:DNA modification methylase
MPKATLYTGDAKDTLASLPAESVQTCVTSPPYWGLRDYGEDGQLGLEETPEEYVQKLVEVFREVQRVLRDDGTVWLNIGDSYARNPAKGGSGTFNGRNGRGEDYAGAERGMGKLKEKDLTMIPSRVAMALQADGWWVRSRIVWAKGNPMPESVTDRPTSSHEYIFLLSKSKQYYYDPDAIRENAAKGNAGSRFDTGKTNGHMKGRSQEGQREDDGTRNKRDVWQVNTKPFPDAHFAVYPPELIEPCIKAGTSKKGECPECGAPWERVVEKEFVGDNRDKRDDQPALEADESNLSRPPNDGGIADREFKGWDPTCNCPEHDSEPQTVLDPFSGAGTTGVVALAKGRDYIGIDLSRDYNEMAADRIRRDAPLMNQVQICEPAYA